MPTQASAEQAASSDAEKDGQPEGPPGEKAEEAPGANGDGGTEAKDEAAAEAPGDAEMADASAGEGEAAEAAREDEPKAPSLLDEAAEAVKAELAAMFSGLVGRSAGQPSEAEGSDAAEPTPDTDRDRAVDAASQPAGETPREGPRDGVERSPKYIDEYLQGVSPIQGSVGMAVHRRRRGGSPPPGIFQHSSVLTLMFLDTHLFAHCITSAVVYLIA